MALRTEATIKNYEFTSTPAHRAVTRSSDEKTPKCADPL